MKKWVAPILAVIAILLYLLFTKFLPEQKYNKALQALQNGDVDTAQSLLIELGDFKDAKELLVTHFFTPMPSEVPTEQPTTKPVENTATAVPSTNAEATATPTATPTPTPTAVPTPSAEEMQKKTQAEALALFENNDFEGALSLLQGDKAQQSVILNMAEKLLANQEFAMAKKFLTALDDYENSKTKLQEVDFAQAEALLKAGDFAAAKTLFATLGEFNGAQNMLTEVDYQQALQLIANKDTETAKNILIAIKEYKDSQLILDELHYAQAEEHMHNGDYAAANALYECIQGYADSQEKAKEATYQLAKQALANEELNTANTLFTELGEYSDSPTQLQNIQYSKAVKAIENKDYSTALATFQSINSFANKQEGFANIALTAIENCITNNVPENAQAWLNLLAEGEEKLQATLQVAKKLIDNQKITEAQNLLQNISTTQANPEIQALRETIAQKQKNSGDYISAHANAIASGKAPAHMRYLHPHMLAQAKELLHKGEFDAYLKAQEYLHNIGLTKKTDVDHANFTLFLQKYPVFNYGRYNEKDVQWQIISMENGRILAISTKPLDKITYDKFTDVPDEHWLQKFGKAFHYLERRHIVRTKVLKLSAIEKYLQDNNILKNGDSIWTSSRTKGFRGYYSYNPGTQSFEGQKPNNEHDLHPVLELFNSKGLMHHMLNGNYHFYDVDGKEEKFTEN